MSLSLAAVLAGPAALHPHRPAIVFGGQTWSYDHLWRQARQYATVLTGRGVLPGDRVALLLSNTPHFAMAYFGALAAGAVVVPVHALLKAEEIAYVLEDSQARLLVCSGAHLAAGSKAAEVAGIPVLTVLAGDDEHAGRLDVLAEAAEPVSGYLPREPADAAVVLYTSGTTGRSKGAVLTHANLVMNIGVTMISPFDLTTGDVLLLALPLFHTFGQICGMGVCFRAGATMVLMPSFDAGETLDLMVRHGPVVFMGVPTMYLALLDAVRARGGTDRPRIERAYSGGSALPVRVLEEIEEVFGCPVYEGYGLTETSPVVAYNQPGLPRRPGTVGWPVWGVEVAVAAADVEGRIEPLAPGEIGEIIVRGHNVMAGYLGRPEATAAVLVDGWFRTGDLGHLGPDGCLTLVDRKKDLVIRNGYNVYPREVEEVLARHPAIAQVSVIGVPHPRHGEEVCAVVRPAPGSGGTTGLGEEIVAWSRERLAGHKYPRRVEFVDSFPLGPSGKVLKRELTARYAADQESRSTTRVPAISVGE
ncbi:long-chain-fatty-acid--CoA ligase [Winogradskya humida]|uniref:AMP-dependent synthetase n=1 Tax=Winogradskya humida TaxID=113566 RepID=A0ABQ3ZWY9_9ACTN|nr:long-chain fatty acid--CoA ligase [Actinoplanes humidus]GIE23037.1 AMP-dependent synthetase [Actinoplanes humidus]